MRKKILFVIITLVLAILLVVVSTANFHQANNLNQLLAQNLDGRLVPHKANYTNKLKNILDDNLRSFEFDTLFNVQARQPYFEIGHDDTELNGRSFEEYLKITKDLPLKKLWMDIKNVDLRNIKQILRRLDQLNQQYNFKNILIFETSATSPALKLISDAGYHTSFYLPKTLLQIRSDNDVSQLKKEANRIKQLVESQHLKALSFRLSHYGFVKTYVEPIIANNIVYHVWDAYKFKTKDELLTLQNHPAYQDARIKTILYTYYNNKLNRLYKR